MGIGNDWIDEGIMWAKSEVLFTKLDEFFIDVDAYDFLKYRR